MIDPAVGCRGRPVVRLGSRADSQPPQAIQDLLEQHEIGPCALLNRTSRRGAFVREIVDGPVCRLLVELADARQVRGGRVAQFVLCG